MPRKTRKQGTPQADIVIMFNVDKVHKKYVKHLCNIAACIYVKRMVLYSHNRDTKQALERVARRRTRSGMYLDNICSAYTLESVRSRERAKPSSIAAARPRK